MVESIAPVVYGTKARYRLAVILHAASAGLAGAAFGLALAGLGALLQAPWGTAGKVAIVVAALAYAARELFGLPLPLFDRRQQVPDWWRTFYGPHVAASLYGAGLGIGFLTFLRYGTYVVVCVLAVFSGEVLVGALLGGTFGLSRGLTTLMSSSARDEIEAGLVVEKLEGIAAGRRPRMVNGAALIAIALVALMTSCDLAATSRSTPPGRDASDNAEVSETKLLGRLGDRRIGESSGLVASRTHEGVLWTHNDSGSGPFLYALDMHGRTMAVVKVRGADAIDWEDIALGPGTTGDDLYIGDIGDNDGVRSEIRVYRVSEPDPRGESRVTSPAATITLTYPDAAQNAEALLVHPESGDLYVVTKQLSGRATVYAVRAPLTDGTLEKVARLEPGADAYGGITAGDISPTGDRVALATYAGALEFVLPPNADDFDDIWAAEAAFTQIARRVQGESIAYDPTGDRLLTTSEGPRSPLLATRPST